jgi:DNA-binding NarL/FixJ family response regulator
METIQVLLAADDEVFQEGLCRFVADEEDMKCVGRPTSGEDTVRLTKELKPDVVIIDVDLPLSTSTAEAGHAVEVAKQVKETHPDTAILFVSGHGFQPSMLASVQAGAAGYLLKKTSRRELINALRALHAREAVFDLDGISRLIGSLAANRSVALGGAAQLRPRETEVLRAVARGMSNKEIASELCISERTVQSHMVRIFQKLQVSSRTEAVLRALREGWVILDDLP